MKSTSALLALAASTSASPLVSKRDDVLGSKETLCKGWDLRTPEGADDLWEKTAAGVSLELFIKSHWGKYSASRSLTRNSKYGADAQQSTKTHGSRTWKTKSRAARQENLEPPAARPLAKTATPWAARVATISLTSSARRPWARTLFLDLPGRQGHARKVPRAEPPVHSGDSHQRLEDSSDGSEL